MKYWSDFPWEVVEDLAGLDAFLEFTGPRPRVHKFLEPGCGEGHLALALARKGFDYLGVELAPSALEKARLRVTEAALGDGVRFVLHDATDLSFLDEGSFDFALDSRFLHMLVVDQDRHRYFEQYLDVFKPDLTTVEKRTAYSGGKEVKVHIPKVPARPKDKAGYTREMEESGFELVRFQVLESYTGCRFYARVLLGSGRL